MPISANALLSIEQKERIETLVKTKEAEYGISGQSLAILKNGALVYATNLGLSNHELNVATTEKTVYQVFSLAKLFVNVVLMQLVESNQIELDAPISRYVQKLPESWNKISVRQAMSHTSGLPEYYNWPHPTPATQKDAIQSVVNKPFEFKTASATRYNQTNYLLLKQVIENVLQQDFVSVMNSRMIQKLDLKHTSYAGEYEVVSGRATTYRSTPAGLKRNVHIDQPDYMFASSGLNTNVLDLAKWFSALLNHQFISQETIDAMWKHVLLDDGKVADFAQGWEYREENGVTIVGHGGGNRTDVRHYFKADSDKSVTIIYFTNGSERGFWPGSVSAEIVNILESFEDHKRN